MYLLVEQEDGGRGEGWGWILVLGMVGSKGSFHLIFSSVLCPLVGFHPKQAFLTWQICPEMSFKLATLVTRRWFSFPGHLAEAPGTAPIGQAWIT